MLFQLHMLGSVEWERNINGGYARIWKVAVMPFLDVLSLQLYVETEWNHETLQPR
jgi:hypothetical protein